MYAAIKEIEYYLPKKVLTNKQLEKLFPDWLAAKIKDKTGIEQRHIADDSECASDLAFMAAKKLFESSNTCKPADIDFLLFCTQSPDYFLPTTACILQDKLSFPTSCGALDFNLGCSGYVYGVSLAKGLIESNQARNILLITAETYSKYIKPDDKSVMTIFGDAAAATLIQATDSAEPLIGPVFFGTDGKGANNLIVKGGASRNQSIKPRLFMNGSEIFVFTLQVVVPLVHKLLHSSNKTINDIDLFIFHQANKYMLDYLREKLKIPQEKFYLCLESTGNTVSSSIPIALKNALQEKKVTHGDCVMLIGFGVGYSWGGTIITIS